MAFLLRMPGVSADADTALLDHWAVSPGERVSEGTVLGTVETDKALVEIEADADAVVHTLLIADGTRAPVGDPIAVLSEPGEDPAVAADLVAQLRGASEPEPSVETIAVAEDMQAADPETPKAPAAPTPEPEAPAAPARRAGERIFSSPLARRLAKEYGLELDDIPGTGPANRITKKDVEAARARAAQQPAPAVPAPTPTAPAPTAEVTRIPHTRLRRAIANRLQASKQNAPHFYLTRELDLGPLLALRAEVNAAAERRVSVNDLLVKAAGLALQRVPEANVSWSDDEMLQYAGSDVAVAVASERGLVTPVIRGVEQLGITALAAAISDLAARAGEGRLQQRELEGGSLTVSNLGMFGIDDFAAILNPPQSTILAIGTAKPRPWVDESGQLSVATTCRITASFDHRAIDGALGAQYLQALATLIAHPIQLLI
ncbi:dihydrolipoamide acetyltransferase family protein [Micropruina sp.]|uniref:dihydrolipoamide acetyltransferase family protein n=1 Tax=Micropruina sp. TaxID=2737536 RepID=UPI00261CE52B|nr:dihydrolipoamide acetyltransferase family protein [Micropruina sp.]